MGEVGTIKRLSEEVVNRIAAGEVIQRPANAVKEMLENSLDAKATSIVITLKEGGLKFLQIQDNGTGIKKCDMGIVCERFTTSKLSRFEDLADINTYGFRGEALASITHVSRVTILSKTHYSLCAYKCSYRDSKLIGALKSCAGNNGTQITAEDLFYNVPMRRHALKSALEEHRKVVDVVSRYAIHNPATEFIVRKQNDMNADVKTQAGSSKLDNIRLLHGPSIAKEMIGLREEDGRLGFKLEALITNANYSSKKHSFILFINHRLVDSSDLRKALETSYAAYLPKNAYPFIYISLEIDSRSIDVNVHPTKSEVHFLNEAEVIDAVQKKVDACLLSCNHSRTYFTQTLLPVNIKADESQIEEARSQKSQVRDDCMIRTDPKARKIDSFLVRMGGDDDDDDDGRNNNTTTTTSTTNNNNSNKNNNDISDDNSDDGVSVMEISGGDGRKRRISFSSHVTLKQDGRDNSGGGDGNGGGDDGGDGGDGVVNNDTKAPPSLKIAELKGSGSHERKHGRDFTKQIIKPSSSQFSSASSSSSPLVSKRRKISLSSVSSLKKEIESGLSIGLKEMLGDSTWVGVVDARWSLVQHSTKLYLVHTHKLIEEYFYQLFIWDFGNFGVMTLSEPASIHELCMLGLQHPESGWKASDGPQEELASFVVQLLTSKAPMLWDYFSVQIDPEGNLLSLPLVMDNFIPPLNQLPHLLIRISTEVDWEREKSCFSSLARELSRFYSTPPCPPTGEYGGHALKQGYPGNANEDGNGENDKFNSEIENSKGENDNCTNANLISINGFLKEPLKDEDGEEDGDEDDLRTEWSTFKWRMEHVLYPGVKRHLLPSKKLSCCLLQVANLPDLYKVFERC